MKKGEAGQEKRERDDHFVFGKVGKSWLRLEKRRETVRLFVCEFVLRKGG